MRTFLVSAFVAGMIGGAAIVYAHRQVASTPPPPSTMVAQWAAGCQRSPSSCVGDIYYWDGFPQRFDRAGDDIPVLDALSAGGTLNRIERVVKLDGDPASYGKASRDFYRRNGR